MRRFAGMMVVAAAVASLAGCAAPPASTAPAPRAVQTVTQAPTQEATAPIVYRSPRYPLHSDRFEFRSGTFQPSDDGMGPRGDVSFFYDGATFFVIPNTHAGSERGIAPVAGTSYGQGPIALEPGARYRVKTPDGQAILEIERLDPGTMRLTPDEGSGRGAVVFRYAVSG